MTVGEFQQGGSFMLCFDDVLRVMKERSFFTVFKKMIEDAEDKMKEKCIIPEEDLKNLHLVRRFKFVYDVQKNAISICAYGKNLTILLYKKKIILDSEIEEMKKLSDFLENQYTKKLRYFGVSFNESECETSIVVCQKKVDKEVVNNEYYGDQEGYFEQMYCELESDLKKIGIICIDLAKVSEWSAKFIVD